MAFSLILLFVLLSLLLFFLADSIGKLLKSYVYYELCLNTDSLGIFSSKTYEFTVFSYIFYDC